MTNKCIERELRHAGFRLVRNGSKHAIWSDAHDTVTVAHGKMSFGAVREVQKTIRRAKERHEASTQQHSAAQGQAG